MAGHLLISQQLLNSPALAAFEQFTPSEPSILVEELSDATKALLALLLLQTTRKNILLISSGPEDQLYQNLSTFSSDTVFEFPSWETLPGEEIIPSSDIIGKRFETLFELLHASKPCILLCPLQAALQKLPSPHSFKPLCHHWKLGDEIPFSSLPDLLTNRGYRRVPVVSDKGEFALRGGILDLFPLSSFDPYRLEFFGDTIDQVRTFDPVSQKSIGKVDSLFLPPASEIDLLKQDPSLATLLDYLADNTLVIFNNLLALEDRYVSIKNMPGATGRYFLTFEQLFSSCISLSHHFWAEHPIEELSDVQIARKRGRQYYSGKDPLQPLTFHILDQEMKTKRWQHPFRDAADFFSPTDEKAAASGHEILQGINRFAKSALDLHFICATEAEEHALKERISQEKISLPPSVHFERGYLSHGFVIADSQLAYVPNTALTHRYQPRRQKWRNTYHTPASEFHELTPGDLVVHFHQGIAKYLGIEKRPNHTGQLAEFMVLEYAEKSKFFVPASQSHLVSRYIGVQEEIPTLSTLGSSRWQKTRIQAQQAIIGYADQLLRHNASRELHGGFTFSPDSQEMQLFEADFPFVETEDQLQAVDQVKGDMTSAKAMDRLICGDVGYGKTEVAMRAAFKAVVDGKKQVAILVPTTVLAMQHYETFSDRMANFPLTIGVLSRFRTVKENKETLKKAADGKIDILIGTHRLISKDVLFKDLGLIIIDEEQRFGVRAKEHLKTLKTGVDCLTLSATPIPRTLYMSLIGARDISVINTPPQDRLPIKSIIAERESSLIQNALLRELSRDGQAYLIHNRVESIFSFSDEIQKLLPQARIVVGHGQMSPDELDAVFHAFKNGEADILITTTIIENGIDIPNANTILIDRADTFGLADLYQMRGRVGRWNRPAYAYFLVPQRRELADLPRKRLQALVEASGYGGGMKIAMRDLEIRGAGDILGTQQSGHVSTIGFHLYCKLLKKAIEALRNKSSPTFTETKLEFSYPASLPDTYINEGSLRMEIYHRLGEAISLPEIDAILAELKDRFGPYPPEVLWLYHLTRLRLFASQRQFTLLKFENLTFTAERQEGKQTVRKTLSLPRTKKPDEWEKQVIDHLAQAFTFSR
jgi:transcription-repair coupling factor (superfamily II helicase)